MGSAAKLGIANITSDGFSDCKHPFRRKDLGGSNLLGRET